MKVLNGEKCSMIHTYECTGWWGVLYDTYLWKCWMVRTALCTPCSWSRGGTPAASWRGGRRGPPPPSSRAGSPPGWSSALPCLPHVALKNGANFKFFYAGICTPFLYGKGKKIWSNFTHHDLSQKHDFQRPEVHLKIKIKILSSSVLNVSFKIKGMAPKEAKLFLRWAITLAQTQTKIKKCASK